LQFRFVKILHPDQGHTEKGLADYLHMAPELRRGVKQQLKKMQPLEYAKTSFSYIKR